MRVRYSMSFLRLWLITAITTLSCATGAQDFRPNLGPNQDSISVNCGEIALLLRRSSQWTPGRIDFRGTAMTTEKSAYGTVFSFPETGFIGTAHLENEPEDLRKLTFILDGRELGGNPGKSLEGKQFRFVRESRIRNFALTCEIEIKDNRLYETTTVATDRAQPLKLVYHFMHAWTPTASMLIAGLDEGPEDILVQPLKDEAEVNRKMYLTRRFDWIAIYEPASKQFAVSRLLEAPDSAGNLSMVWNVPGTYRKFYLKCFESKTVPAGFKGTWRMVTAFGVGEPEVWQAKARKLALDLRD
ncbi:MAG: hypothetical protein HKN23_10760 [Verrucomicrobiales bacterium]|nr:hypothetical protein [Verrucomicrobiales bacterium]